MASADTRAVEEERERRPTPKWWGWGPAEQHTDLPAHMGDFLRTELGADLEPRPAASLDDMSLEEPRLADDARAALVAAVGDDSVRQDRLARVVHGAGKSYPDLVRQRAGTGGRAPDAVVSPGSHAEVRAVLDACAEAGVAVVPFGGGTSVVGGVEPLSGSFAAVISLDLSRLDRLLDIDERSLTATLEAGVLAPRAEELLNRRGLTLGHFPQSYEQATIGGYVATRSAGQASTGYGRIDELVLGLRMAAPAGDIELPARPASAAGPDLRQLLVGSEGTLGVITAASLKVRPRPADRRYEGWFFRSFAEGAEAFRTIEQEHVAPDVARLSDEEETRLSLAAAGEGAKRRVADVYLRARRYGGGCLAIVGWEGTEPDVARRRARTVTVLRRAGGLALGRSPGRAWERTRFLGPYQRDALLDHGVAVDTLETATQWSRVAGLHRAVRGALETALRGRGTPPLVMCHISHLYPSGCSLYFTWIARQEPGAELAQWRAAKTAASEAIVAENATITHHHAVGTDHARWLAQEDGELGLAALRAVKRELDPAGIMNPGKLFFDGASESETG